MEENKEIKFCSGGCKDLLLHKALANASVVAAFFPLVKEPNIIPLLEILAKEGRLLLPRCKSNYEMTFFKVKDLSKDLKAGKFGIKEPIDSLQEFNEDIPIFLVPGTSFSLDGHRHGHGLGYYDRFLFHFPDSYKIGICTKEQLSETSLKIESHDVIMNEIFVVKN